MRDQGTGVGEKVVVELTGDQSKLVPGYQIDSAIHHPPHYNAGQIEPIDVIEDWKLGFSLGNAVKYIARAEHKGSPLEDLKKARWYLDREIQRREKA